MNVTLAAKPLLRWAGSKKKLLKTLQQAVPKGFTRYIEPFLGSGALYFALRPNAALLSDTNNDLIETYINVRDDPSKVFSYYHEIKQDKETYYSVRRIKNNDLHPASRAGKFIYLNRLCFNGLYRTNKDGGFNVPYGGYKNGKMPTLAELEATSAVLINAKIECIDFEASIKQVEENNLVFLDPPYLIKNKRVFREYGPVIFNDKDLVRLVEALETINSRKAYFILTFADSEEARQILQKWNVVPILIKRNIAGFSERRVDTSELIVTNYLW